jgi:hypothetical protein
MNKLRLAFDDNAKQTNSFLGVALNELGCAYLQNSKNTEAVIAFEESLTLIQKLKESPKQVVTIPQINLGFTYALDGRLEKSIVDLRPGIAR